MVNSYHYAQKCYLLYNSLFYTHYIVQVLRMGSQSNIRSASKTTSFVPRPRMIPCQLNFGSRRLSHLSSTEAHEKEEVLTTDSRRCIKIFSFLS